jgi:hypothetical protein
MRSILLVFATGCCMGCGLTDNPDMRELKTSLRITGEEVVAKQDESIVILKENTTALAAIKSQVESLNSSILETRQAVGTMEAKLVVPQPQVKEVIKSALEPQKDAKGSNNTSPSVASPSAVRSSEVKMAWNVEGNWNPSILETARHLREDHGFIADGLTHQQMHDAHAAFHEGRKSVAMRAPPVQMIGRGTSCPGGVCPVPRVQIRRRR